MYKKITLNNGVRIVYEKIPYVRSVSLGIWVGAGSRNENAANNGISHFIEHMLFKGTDKRTAKEIAESIDNIGGQLNAFTGKECTCFYTKTLDTHIDIALDVLSDMFFKSKMSQKDIDVERKVILEEINMYEDSPEELVHDLLSEAMWSGNALSYPILGTQQSLSNINPNTIRDYMAQGYTPNNTVIAIAGNFEEKALVEKIKHIFGGWASSDFKLDDYEKADCIKNMVIKEKDTEQVHVCMGFCGVEHGDDKLYALLAVNNIFGGGMSSKLFQKIREEMGLVYSIYSYPSSYKKSGLFTIYAGMNPQHLDKVISLVSKEISELVKNKLTKDELDKSKEQLKGSYMLGLESTSSRMNSIGKSELLLHRINTPEEILNKIDNINMDAVSEVISIFDLNNVSFAAVGNIKKDTDLNKLL